MIRDNISKEDLQALQKEKGSICVSIVIPTHRLSPGRRADRSEAEKCIEQAKQLLQFKYSDNETVSLINEIDKLLESIDFNHQLEGIGLYVSPKIKLLVRYPFPVDEKVMVDRNFEVRDLLYRVNNAVPYLVLMLTKAGARLFEGQWNELKEVNDGRFPKEYHDEYIYNPPSRGNSYAGNSEVKSFEKDKSTLEEIRFKDFFRHSDDLLKDYLAGNKPLVLLGTEEEMAWFENVSLHKKNIIAKHEGSYNYSGRKELGDLVWPLMWTYLQDQGKLLVKDFQEKIGQGLGVSGIQDVWSAVQEGKGLKLLVEKDYRSPGFLTENEYHLYVRPPEMRHTILTDAVDEIIEKTMEKNGHVIFVENGVLKDYKRIALITRY